MEELEISNAHFEIEPIESFAEIMRARQRKMDVSPVRVSEKLLSELDTVNKWDHRCSLEIEIQVNCDDEEYDDEEFDSQIHSYDEEYDEGFETAEFLFFPTGTDMPVDIGNGIMVPVWAVYYGSEDKGDRCYASNWMAYGNIDDVLPTDVNSANMGLIRSKMELSYGEPLLIQLQSLAKLLHAHWVFGPLERECFSIGNDDPNRLYGLLRNCINTEHDQLNGTGFLFREYLEYVERFRYENVGLDDLLRWVGYFMILYEKHEAGTTFFKLTKSKSLIFSYF